MLNQTIEWYDRSELNRRRQEELDWKVNIISDKNSLLDGLLQELIKKVQEVMREVRELFGSSLGGQMLSQNQKQLTPVLKAPNGLVWSSSLRHADIEINGNQATRTADTTEEYWACCLADIGKNRAANWSIRIIEQTSKAMAVGIISESLAKAMKFASSSSTSIGLRSLICFNTWPAFSKTSERRKS